MRPRCIELPRVLKKTGSFYYHCDRHASHDVKVMLDQIFSENNFRGEIIWGSERALMPMPNVTAFASVLRWHILDGNSLS